MKFSIRYKTLLSYGIVLILAFAAQVMIFTAAREFIYQQVVYLHREKAVHASDFIKQFSDGIELDLVTLGRNYFRLDESEPFFQRNIHPYSIRPRAGESKPLYRYRHQAGF